ncbi:BglG family transcription antiterminator [Lacticaseibacillus salsurivasis]|uniref:BglG family transcription antiterminator n=1 Tax=Lacticaseibacillus salsurivasis TaxID=3081441 RepID=UPI0030C68766
MNSRQVDLLKMLCGENGFIAANSLSKRLHVSNKTIYKDLDNLLSELKGTNVKLIRRPRVGIRLSGSATDKKELLDKLRLIDNEPINEDRNSIEFRRDEMVRKIILNEESQTLKDISEQWLVSKTSVLHDIEYINKTISTTNGTVESNGKTICFWGDEEQRQVAVARYLATATNRENGNLKDSMSNFFTEGVFETIEEVFGIVRKRSFVEVPAYYLLALKLVTMIQIYRLMKDVHFEGSRNPQDYKEDSDVYGVAEQVLKMASDRLPFYYTEADVERLARNFSAYRLGNEVKDQQYNWEETIETLMARMEAIQKMSFLGKAQLKKQLLYHVPAMVLRLKQGLVVRNPLLNDIKEQYPALFGMTWYALSFLEEKYGIALNDDEVSFITIYFHTSLNKVIPSSEVIILYGQHSQLRGYVESQVQQLLPANTKLTQTTVQNFRKVDKEGINLIIAVDVTGVVSDIPMVAVTPLIDSKDKAKILVEYAENVVLNQQPESDIHFPLLKGIISPDLIFWKEEMSNKNEALDFLIQKLENKGIVSENFGDSIYRRERLGSTEIEGGSALPHANPKTVKETKVAILVLRKPVWWNTENVSIVILACVPNKQIKDYRQLILDIYQLVQNREMVKMIVGLNSTKALIKMIQR